MGKIGTITLAILLAGGVNITNSSAAQTNGVKEVKSDTEVSETTDFVKYSGVIKDIEKNKEKWTLTIEAENGEPTIVFVNPHSFIFHNNGEKFNYTQLEKGSTVEAFIDKNKPMILIYPAQVTPDFLIVKDEKSIAQVKVSKFDDSFLSLDGQLKLNISEETILTNQLGESIEQEDLKRKDLVVFYSFTTRSLPPQTSPTRIIAFDKSFEMKERVAEIIKKDHVFKDGVKMIPLRAVAEELGYEVKSDRKKKVYVTKQNVSYTITRGKKVYGFNRSIGHFNVAPIIKDKRTYVPEQFLDLLLENI